MNLQEGRHNKGRGLCRPFRAQEWRGRPVHGLTPVANIVRPFQGRTASETTTAPLTRDVRNA